MRRNIWDIAFVSANENGNDYDNEYVCTFAWKVQISVVNRWYTSIINETIPFSYWKDSFVSRLRYLVIIITGVFYNGYLLYILTFHYLFCTLPCWTIAYMHLNDWMFIQSCHQVCLLCKMLMDQQSHSRCVFTRRCLLFTKNEIFIYKCIYNQQKNIFSFMHVLVEMEYDTRIRTISFISSGIIKNSYNKSK